MATDKNNLRADLKAIVDEVVALRDAYVHLQSYAVIQEQSLAREKDKSLKLRGRLKTAINTFSTLKERSKTAWDKAQKENESSAAKVNELTRECNQLRSLVTDRNSDDHSEYVSRLEGELAALRTQLEFQEGNRTNKLTVHHEQIVDEKLPNRTEGTPIHLARGNLLVSQPKRRRTRNPSLTDPSIVSAPRVDDTKARKNVSWFRWPSLNVTITSVNEGRGTRDDGDQVNKVDANASTAMERKSDVGMKSLNKKRKLYSDDKQDTVDVCMPLQPYPPLFAF